MQVEFVQLDEDFETISPILKSALHILVKQAHFLQSMYVCVVDIMSCV